MNNVIPLAAGYIKETSISFNAEKLAYEAKELYSVYQRDQINLRKPHNIDDMLGITYGSGSLYQKGEVFDNDKSWNEYISIFKDLYLVEVLKELEEHVWFQHRSYIGRARLMRMKPKTCLTYHKDDSSMRLHIPIVTNEGCFFINNEIVGKMHDTGRLYLYDVKSKHTAVNASREDRIHLVVNCYQ